MSCRHLFSLFLAGFFVTAAALANGHTACAKCHEADEYVGMSAADIAEAVRDPGVPPHKQFAELSDEHLQAIAVELSGG